MMKIAQNRYQLWLQDESIDSDTLMELRGIADDSAEIEDRFYKDLEFGTGGLRGMLGAGTNRINAYTIGRATQGLAGYLLHASTEEGEGRPEPEPEPESVQRQERLCAVIAYDSRNQSPELALEAAMVLAGNGIAAYVFESLRPTPELSYAVRRLKASAGIVITASHNPPEYNGYKVYGADGCQLVPDKAERVIAEIRQIGSFAAVKKMKRETAEKAGLLRWIGEETDQEYIRAVTAISHHTEPNADLKIVYTPLHGAGTRMVGRALNEIGLNHLYVVKEQEQPDPLFSTVASPNPEEKEAFTLAIKLAKEVGADIIIGTDPDCDRMGAVVKNKQGEYNVLTGNQSGAIMIHYLLTRLRKNGSIPSNGIVIKTIVTSEMGARIAESFGLAVMNTLTGFKYIGDLMTQFEISGTHEFIFGYEESYGYLAGTYCRDKDAVLASMLICEAAAYYKSQGKTLYDVLQELFETYGYYQESLESRTLKGIDGLEKINSIMSDWRSRPPGRLNGIEVTEVLDYSGGIDELPLENVLKYKLADGSWFCLRPSGTEPKIKIYMAVCGKTESDATAAMAALTSAVAARMDSQGSD